MLPSIAMPANRCGVVPAFALLAAIGLGSAEETPLPPPAPVTPPAAVVAPTPEPLPAQTKDAPIGSIEALVKDALAGSAAAVTTLRTAALAVDDRTAMALLDRIRATRVSRSSAVAACFVPHREAWVQRTALTTIAKLGADGPGTINLLVRTIAEAPALVAQGAAQALTELRDARAWPGLIDLLNAKDPDQVRLAHDSLQRQTRQALPPERSAWDDWYRARKDAEATQFADFQAMLADPTGNHLTAVEGLASLQLMRDQATAVLITLAQHPDPAVHAQVERHLRQWTGTIGTESLATAVDRAQDVAVAPPPVATPATPTSTRTVEAPADASVAAPGFFETTYGMLLIVTICSAVLALLLWFLRTPAGALVQNATHRFTKRIGRSRVVVMMSNGTKRIAKHLPAPMKAITKRFAAPAKVVADRLANETHRMLNPNKPK